MGLLFIFFLNFPDKFYDLRIFIEKRSGLFAFRYNNGVVVEVRHIFINATPNGLTKK